MKRLSYPVAAALYPEAPVQIGQAAHPMSLSLSEITPEGDSAKKIHWPSSVKSPSSDQLPAENCYFHPVFQYFRASIARQSRTAAGRRPSFSRS